jgi:hypothetical protein
MDYAAYFADHQKHWPTIRAIDDALAIWVEKEYPEHDTFDWKPKTEETIEVWVRWFRPDKLINIMLPVAELGI